MKKILLLLLLVLSGCINDPYKDWEPEASIPCTTTPAELTTLTVGDVITDPALAALFATVTPEQGIYSGQCVQAYHFSKGSYDKPSNTYGWCYIYNVYVDCNTQEVVYINAPYP